MGIDVVMPVYGDITFLDKAVRSVLLQTNTNFHLYLILDRPDIDREKSIKSKYFEEKKISVVKSPGIGLVDALNFGMSLGKSEFIARIDSDDLMAPNRLQEQEFFLKQNVDSLCVGSQLEFIGVDDERLGRTVYPIDPKAIKRKLLIQNCIGHPSVCFRRTAFELTGGYRRAFTGAEDYDLWLRMVKIGPIYNLDKELTRYRFSPNQYSRTLGNYQILVEDLCRISYHQEEVLREIIDFQNIYSQEELVIIIGDALRKLRSISKSNYRSVLMANKISLSMRILAEKPRNVKIIIPTISNLLFAFKLKPIWFILYSLQLMTTKSEKVK
jgi:glycosyltransferase involved in cell wall biosynthesis